MMCWTHYNCPETPQAWTFKNDVPKEHRHNAVKIEFSFCCAWIVRDENKRVLMKNGTWAGTVDFYLKTPGHVIGFCDMITADGKPWAAEWRQAYSDWRLGK